MQKNAKAVILFDLTLFKRRLNTRILCTNGQNFDPHIQPYIIFLLSPDSLDFISTLEELKFGAYFQLVDINWKLCTFTTPFYLSENILIKRL